MSVWPERVGQSTLVAGTLLDVDCGTPWEWN